MKSVNYVADLKQVREVTLLGDADRAFWAERLALEALAPAEREGRAQVLVVAADAKFKGIRFRELSVSVLVAGGGAFLVRAFNSLRLFAFVERVFFSTPYYAGDVRVSIPASVRLDLGGETVFRAELGIAPPREPAHVGDRSWEGPVYLPSGRGKGRAFFARLRGHTQTYPFLPATDVLSIRPVRGHDVFQALIDSQFIATEWAVRPDAAHAKSKTYSRSEIAAGTVRM